MKSLMKAFLLISSLAAVRGTSIKMDFLPRLVADFVLIDIRLRLTLNANIHEHLIKFVNICTVVMSALTRLFRKIVYQIMCTHSTERMCYLILTYRITTLFQYQKMRTRVTWKRTKVYIGIQLSTDTIAKVVYTRGMKSANHQRTTFGLTRTNPRLSQMVSV